MHNSCGWYQTQDIGGPELPVQPEAGQRDSAPASPSALLLPTGMPAKAANSSIKPALHTVADQVQGPMLPPKPADDQQDPPPALQSDLHSPAEGLHGADHSGTPVRSRAGAATAPAAPVLAQIPAKHQVRQGHYPRSCSRLLAAMMDKAYT